MNGRLAVIGAVMKRKDKGPFQNKDIVADTGLVRQNVYVHLNNLCNEGILKKQHVYYYIVNEEALVDAVLDVKDKVDRGLMEKNKGLFSEEEIKHYNTMAETIVALQHFVVDASYFDMRMTYAQEIDDTVKELKRLRKFLMNGERSPRKSVRIIEHGITETWNTLVKKMDWRAPCTFDEFIEAVKGRVEDQGL